MLLAFGALIAAGIPVLLAIGSVAATMGIAAAASHVMPAEPTVNSMIVLIGMAVGVDYSLFYLKREREERARGRTTLDAVEIAAQTSGHSILVSGLAVAASMAGLFLVDVVTFNSLALGAIVVVAVAVVGSITVLPALLVALGRWVDRPRVPLLWRLNRRIGAGGISRRVLAPVVRHPAAALAASVAVVGVLAVPALGMTMHASSLETLPRGIPAADTLRAVAEEFPSEGTTVTVVARGDDARSALATLESAAGRARLRDGARRSRRRRGRRHVHADHVAALAGVRRPQRRCDPRPARRPRPGGVRRARAPSGRWAGTPRPTSTSTTTCGRGCRGWSGSCSC